MKAMLLETSPGRLAARELPIPEPGAGQVRIRVEACGICRTDLHVIDAELPHPKLPLIPGHQVVGRVDVAGAGVTSLQVGQRVGVPWLGWTCGECSFCRTGSENLCQRARFTGYDLDGLRQCAVADARYAFAVGEGDTVATAPLLCAGLIGYRTLRFAGDAERIGIYGFGAAAHIVAQICAWQGRRVYAFTRPGDQAAQTFATELGAVWTGGSDQEPPEPLDAALLFAPAGETVPAALRAIRKGGVVVCGGIHMSDIPSFPYALLWGERSIRSVANLTRADGQEFLALAPRVPVRTVTTSYALADAQRALDDLRAGRLQGAGVVVPG
jgi:propanol-preferring alcohol dehydrogenase